MPRRDYRDILGGLLLTMMGVFIVWHASQTLDFGTVRRMGPGMFPMSIGVILAGLGLAILVSGFLRSGRIPEVEWRSTIAVLSSIGTFALTITSFGLIPAIVGLLAVSSLAERQFRPFVIIAMCVALPVMAYLVFRVGLGLPLPMIRSPF